MFFVYWLPLMVATAAGGYLFYAQHNFPEMHVQPRSEWEYTAPRARVVELHGDRRDHGLAHRPTSATTTCTT